jgi:hypothetical protein
MKVTAFAQLAYRQFPADFETRYDSASIRRGDSWIRGRFAPPIVTTSMV